ncbi:hypothetical protein OG204_21460 [Streptomyces sp. NBC_01387]|uniref:hypothetical protein n=1 Tax=unclassified Streptomyces TaxID=2593676 RepID=UPI002023C70C|nr:MULTISPECIES: hypothetical protein [unclassified Streptomyces]MCX4549107.1 hypothetical protein [Streptomyces sp. NBC_01500]WSC20684.1 hypothetical protein OIE60_13855 [Streptomyces sp. NBC_01766]WSV54711.1 hypothetical protein OG282_13900 [Streptomyces sp. NBC_01014]
MSENNESTTPGGPQPESIRFFGTTWVGHDNGYGLRRVAVSVGSLVTTAAACLVMRLAYQGVRIADAGSFVALLFIAVFTLCSALAFVRTWDGFRRRPADPAREESLRSFKAIGFIGSLLAYFFRSLTEAPGEQLLRAEYESAVARYEKRRGTRAGNPAARRKANAKAKAGPKRA